MQEKGGEERGEGKRLLVVKQHIWQAVLSLLINTWCRNQLRIAEMRRGK